MNIERPLDLLNQSKGTNVIVALREGNNVEGVLLAFDLNINLAIQLPNGFRFIRGDNVLSVDKKESK